MTFTDFINKIDFYTGNRNWFTTSNLTLSQREIADIIHNSSDRHILICKGRQGGITTVLTLYALWRAINTPGLSIAFVVNKSDSSYRDVLHRILEKNHTKFKELLSLKVEKRDRIILENDSRILYINGNYPNPFRGQMLDILIIEDFFENYYSISQPHEEIMHQCIYAVNQINGKIIVSTMKNTEDFGWFQQFGFQKICGHFFDGKRKVLIEKTKHKKS